MIDYFYMKSDASDDEIRECYRQPGRDSGIMCRGCPCIPRCRGLALKDLANKMKKYMEENK